jgi:hypothetical protein
VCSSDLQDSGDGDQAEPQKQALNGAQVTALLALAQAVNAGEISPESAMGIIEVSFPVGREEAFKIVGNLGGKKSVVAQSQAQAAKAAKAATAPAAPAPAPAPTPPEEK